MQVPEQRAVGLPVVMLIVLIQDEGVGHLALQVMHYRMVFPVLQRNLFGYGTRSGHGSLPLESQRRLESSGTNGGPRSEFLLGPKPVRLRRSDRAAPFLPKLARACGDSAQGDGKVVAISAA